MGARGLFGLGQALSLFGAGLESKGLSDQGNAAKLRGDYQAAVLRQNAQFYRDTAELAIKRGQIMQQRQQTDTAQFIGRQRSALAANGILVDEGSAVDLARDTARVGRQAELDLKFNAEHLAFQHKVNALNAEADATLAQLTGEQQQRATRLGARANLLSGFGRSVIGTALFDNS